MKKIILSFFLLLSAFIAYSQNASIAGTVRDKATQELLVGVTLVIENSSPLVGTVSDPDGNFKLTTTPGSYNVTATFVGYKPSTKFNVLFSSGNINSINFELEEESTTLNEVVVEAKRTAEAATIETPLSVQRLTTEEIRSNPGGNFDISRVIQALPGVGGATGTASFRNDIIIRGGAPNENVYYLDGIEIPVINHFSTQGSAGGPQGILNVSFIEDVTLSTSAFEARYDNVLSSVLQFKQRNGNGERLQGNARLSATEFATTLDGPLGKNTSFLASARRSYLKFLFKLIDLPIRPDYWDFQYKITHKFSPKTTLSLLGVGAIDRFGFAVPDKGTPENTYIIRSNPLINQESYTVGASLRHLIGGGYLNVALSRNSLDNRLDKFEDGTMPVESQRTLKVRSLEAENKIRIDMTRTIDSWKYSFGAVGNYAQFNNNVYSVIRREIRDQNGNVVQPGLTNEYNTQLDFFKSGVFGQLSKRITRLNVSAGIRSDVNTFTKQGINPLNTLSPRVGLSYSLSDRWNLNASVGRYYKLPVYTILGFKDQNTFINKDSKYIRSDHYVGGIEFLPSSSLRFTVESFYKKYGNYPVSIRDGISVANSGTQFGQVGNEPVVSSGRGRAYGVEFFAQQKLTKNSFFTFSYTWFKSEFSGTDGVFKPSAWDNRNLLSAILGRKFRHNWE
ncbi:MAG TPA: TonB-dependent receptor, partial [Cyclobacteriaceae bacterium]